MFCSTVRASGLVSAVGHSTKTWHRRRSLVAFTSCQSMTDTTSHSELHTLQHAYTRAHTHGPLRRASLQGIQSHGEIWPYRLNWIAVILCLTCFGDVCVGLRDILLCWALQSVQKVQICRSSCVAGQTYEPLNINPYLLTTSPFLNLFSAAFLHSIISCCAIPLFAFLSVIIYSYPPFSSFPRQLYLLVNIVFFTHLLFFYVLVHKWRHIFIPLGYQSGSSNVHMYVFFGVFLLLVWRWQMSPWDFTESSETLLSAFLYMAVTSK